MAAVAQTAGMWRTNGAGQVASESSRYDVAAVAQTAGEVASGWRISHALREHGYVLRERGNDDFRHDGRLW